MTLRIKNWSKHQHFKDRTPPWIKLYREILDDPDWHELDGDTAKVLIGLWLIASEDETHQGALPNIRKLAFRLRIKESQLNQHLNKLSNWLVQVDIDVISSQYQSDAPERAGEEAEAETEVETDSFVAKGNPLPSPESVLQIYHEVLPELPKAKLLDDKRKKSIASFCKWVLTSKRSDGERRATTCEEAIEWIRAYFERTRSNDFLMGRGSKSPGHENWECDIDFLMSDKGKKQVIEKTKDAA